LLDGRDLVSSLSGVADHVGAPAAQDSRRIASPIHRHLLEAMNGFTVAQGTLRMFGIGRGDELDIDRWNDDETWQFAWDDRIAPYEIFGATAWGDQYAYKRMDSGEVEPTIYFLEPTMLRPTVLAQSFEPFMEAELLRVATHPYDSLTIAALNRFGPIEPQDQWTFAPSLALGGPESLDNVVRLRAEAGMTIADDIALSLKNAASISRVTTISREEPSPELDMGRVDLTSAIRSEPSSGTYARSAGTKITADTRFARLRCGRAA
jgi:hypothetical protein